MSEDNELKVKIKGKIRDLLAFSKLTKTREKKFEKASAKPIEEDTLKALAEDLHPDYQHLIIDKIIDNTKSTKTFRLIPDSEFNEALALFRAGQFLSLKVNVNGYEITRPYTISSSPRDALAGFYEVSIKREENGFLTNFIWDNWKVGTKVTSSGPQGFFYFQPLRDSKNIAAIAGGSGITAFRSIAKEVAEGSLDINLTILYGCSDEDDILFYEELKHLEKQNPNKIKLVIVLSCEEVSLEGCETGFITSEIIKKYTDIANDTYFICGPQLMYEFMDEEISKLKISQSRIRKEMYGEIKEVTKFPDYPTKEKAEKVYNIEVLIGSEIKEIPAKATDTVLVSMEKAKIIAPSSCRSGECGFCRSYLISGDIYTLTKSDGRREADKEYNFFHPCSSYPLSDLEIEVPRRK
ncbi:MAG: 2Fe-2S iron-sulfur cluster binding domain-containing protein [Candidatus Lokiarchaeota archaeon]|nr:2Fe-2S iron-sulfur cluster binding domain-containing protein [Candidatus Lokiarchaeota archaeon]